MTTPEGKVKDKLKRILKANGVYWHMPVQNGMGAPSLDFICCYDGHYLAIETKAGNGQPTERQKITMREIEKAGGKTLLINEHEGWEELAQWLIDVACL